MYVYDVYPMAELFRCDESILGGFTQTSKMDELLEKLLRQGSQPHLWITIGENVLQMAMCAETGVAKKVKGTLSNRWMSLVSILSTIIEVTESMNGDVTIKWQAITMAHTDTLCCSWKNLIDKTHSRCWACHSENKCKFVNIHKC